MVHGENAFFAVPNCSAACEGVLRSLRGELIVPLDCAANATVSKYKF